MDFYDEVYKDDTLPGESRGWIQWQGSSICIDLFCLCGQRAHYDGYSLFFYQCAACGAQYALSRTIRLIPLSKEQAEHVETTAVKFITVTE